MERVSERASDAMPGNISSRDHRFPEADFLYSGIGQPARAAAGVTLASAGDSLTKPSHVTSFAQPNALDSSTSGAASGHGGEFEARGALKRQMEVELADFEEHLAEELVSPYAAVNRPMESAAALKGKRLRPRLVLLSALACGGISPRTRCVAAVVEMVHAATLVHDDVLDNADSRRGAPATHVMWGNRTSILLGDLLFSRAYTLAATAGSCFVAQRVGRAGLALCQGEMRQQSTIGNWALGQAEYLDILSQKTGDLCAASSLLGAWSAQADASAMDALERYGLSLGIAFQIYDDWLDVWGSTALGKPLGNDVANRKPTLPVLYLLEQTPDSHRAALIQELDRGNLNTMLRSALDDSDASSLTLATARRFAEDARDALCCLSDSPAKQALIEVAEQSVCRAR